MSASGGKGEIVPSWNYLHGDCHLVLCGKKAGNNIIGSFFDYGLNK
jgi:hypothetical protein